MVPIDKVMEASTASEKVGYNLKTYSLFETQALLDDKLLVQADARALLLQGDIIVRVASVPLARLHIKQ